MPDATAAPSPPPTRTGPRVLIIRPTALGDVARTVPALVTLRNALPTAHIDWLVHEAFADIIAHHPALDGIIAFPRKRFGAILHSPTVMREALRWAGDLRRGRYDLVFDLQGLSRSGLFTWLTRAPRRVGYSNAREMAWLGYNRRHHVDASIHSVDRMLALLNAEGFDSQTGNPNSHAEGFSPGSLQTPDTRLYVGAADQAWATTYLAAHGGADQPYACLAPTARWLTKCWPIERYTQIARQLLDTGIAGTRLVVLASPGERAQVQPLLDALPDVKDRVLIPQTTVGQLAALIRGTNLLVCNDSAPLHIAVGFDRPIAAVFGPTNPALVGPYRRPECVVQPPGLTPADLSNYRAQGDDQSLIARVTVDAVWSKIREQAARKSTPV